MPEIPVRRRSPAEVRERLLAAGLPGDIVSEMTMPDTDVAAEAMVLPADVRAAAEAIEASREFRDHFKPVHPLGRLHPVAVEFARLALTEASP